MRRGPRGPAHTLYLACIFNRKNASQLKSWLFLITRLTPIKNLLQQIKLCSHMQRTHQSCPNFDFSQLIWRYIPAQDVMSAPCNKL